MSFSSYPSSYYTFDQGVYAAYLRTDQKKLLRTIFVCLVFLVIMLILAFTAYYILRYRKEQQLKEEQP